MDTPAVPVCPSCGQIDWPRIVAQAQERQVEESVLTVDEAANVLRVSRTRMKELIASGEIRSYKEGRLRHITRSALLDYIHGKESQAWHEIDAPTVAEVFTLPQGRGRSTRRTTDGARR